MINNKVYLTFFVIEMKKNRREFIGCAVQAAIGGTVLVAGIPSSEYADVWGFDEKYQQGRTKNGLAAVVAGIIGHEMYGGSSVDLAVKKRFWPDARVTGSTSEDSIDTNIDLFWTSSRFRANYSDDRLRGEVHKSEFNWKVEQTGPSTYRIKRWGPKFDSTLELRVADGRIHGTYKRPGPHFDWSINGSYDAQGHVNVRIDGPLTLGIELEGRVTARASPR